MQADEDNSKKEFDWFEDTAEFGFEDVEEHPAETKWAKSIYKKLTPFSMGVIGVSLFITGILYFIPRHLIYVKGYSLMHVCFVAAFLAFIFLMAKLLVHVVFVIIKDNISNNKVFHSKRVKLEVTCGIWIFSFIPIGIYLNSRVPWARALLDKLFACGIISLLIIICKNIFMEMFRTYFLASALKKKSKDVEIKERIINSMRDFCYDETGETSDDKLISCFLVNCFEDEDDDPNNNLGMEFVKGDMDNIIGDLFTTSIFQKKQLSQHEIFCLARDTFLKCSKDGEYITFNSFCEIFPNAQTAVQAFLYFDTDNAKKISKKDIRDTLAMFHYDRKNLQTTFENLNRFVKLLDNLATIVVCIPLLFLYLIVLGLPIRQLAALGLSSAVVLNFLISSVIKDFYWNASFILTHPFDIGDEVIIDGKDYTIYGSSLYKTEVLSNNGGKISFLNKVLGTKNIVNMTRAPQKLIHVNFQLTPQTTPEKFKELKRGLLVYLRSKSEIFYETFTIQSESEASCKLEGHNCVLIVRYKSINNRMAKLEVKLDLVRFLKDILQNHHTPPPTSEDPEPAPAK
ncbi:hypothetical protein NEHOM01_0397 [Nematocida homosporus]|uniref:uncharacterized protein n=1 Tax=Nematocida homosporus TaxID=1912981 RepID=UPI0022201779|nr:uncharacterized protein NEHOM01_0397 [Nematocida homosporus]KAI5184795.1 hypothetical protein NEHOM01_0397 [Nematocida homosporus]